MTRSGSLALPGCRGVLPLVGLLALVTLAACGPAHLQDYVPKQRDYAYPIPVVEAPAARSTGSLYSAGRSTACLTCDHRARALGDLVVVRVEERADASRGASTELSREGGVRAGLDSFLSLISSQEVKAGLESTFRGGGATSRSERLQATVTALVRKVLPNGTLFIEGHRALLVNGEEHHFYISGVIRPTDVGPDNSVPSSLIADAQIEFTGRGVVSDKQRPGWLHRGLDYISPF